MQSGRVHSGQTGGPEHLNLDFLLLAQGAMGSAEAGRGPAHGEGGTEVGETESRR